MKKVSNKAVDSEQNTLEPDAPEPRLRAQGAPQDRRDPNNKVKKFKKNERVSRVSDRRKEKNVENIVSDVPNYGMNENAKIKKLEKEFDGLLDKIKEDFSKLDGADARLSMLERLDVAYNGVLSGAVSQKFKPLAAAPALWKQDRLPKETPPEFIRRVYGEQIAQGMKQADLKRVDLSAYRALHQYAQLHKAEGVKASDVVPSSQTRVAAEERSSRVEPRAFGAGRPLTASERESYHLYHALKSREARERRSTSLK